MASEELSDRVRDLTGRLALAEKKMFGGRCFMLSGNMLVCAMKNGALLVRTGQEFYGDALQKPGCSPMLMGSKTMSGFVEVSGDAVEDDDALSAWIDLAKSFVDTLPVK